MIWRAADPMSFLHPSFSAGSGHGGEFAPMEFHPLNPKNGITQLVLQLQQKVAGESRTVNGEEWAINSTEVAASRATR
jgi:hypothetical protein